MDAVLESKQFTSDEVCQINYYRLYLQAITISDISIAGGSRLDPYFLKGSKGPMSSETKLHHVNQARPNERSWNLWQKANYLWTSRGTKLKQPLGRWLVTADKLRQSWKAYLDPLSHELLLHHNEQHYNLHSSHNKGFQLQSDGHTNTLPPECRPASVLKGPHTWAVRTTKAILHRPKQTSQSAGTFEAFIEDLPEWERLLLYQIEYH